MATNKKLRALYDGFFEGLETSCANLISNITELYRVRKYCKTKPTKKFKKMVNEFWKRYKMGILPPPPIWAWYYASQNGIEDPRYIPNTMYYTTIDQHFNNRKLGWGFNDKNYYSRIFHGIKQPQTLVRNVNGILLDKDYNLITTNEAVDVIKEEKEVVCKPTLETGSGRDVCFWKTNDNYGDIVNFINSDTKNYIIQGVIKQHAELSKIHEESINTLRIVSILMKDGVYILSSNLRMGTGSSRVDNVSGGGISCGINPDGSLKDYATDCYTGAKFYRHPQGTVFKGLKIPSYSKVLDLVKSAHPIIPHFRLVSWDIAVDVNGDPLLIEANMRKGMINLNQFNNGPLFGDLTDRVLEEVFKRR